MEVTALSSVVVACERPFAFFLVYFFVKKYTKETRGMPLPRHSPSPPRMNKLCGLAEDIIRRVPGSVSAAAGFALIKGSPVQGELSSDNETEGLQLSVISKAGNNPSAPSGHLPLHRGGFGMEIHP